MRDIYGYLLMEHGVHNLFEGYELSLIVRISEAKADLLTSVPVKTQKVLLRGPELC